MKFEHIIIGYDDYETWYVFDTSRLPNGALVALLESEQRGDMRERWLCIADKREWSPIGATYTNDIEQAVSELMKEDYL